MRLVIFSLRSELPRCRRNVSDARVSLSYETVREWCLKFGQTYANALRHKSPRPGDRWHLDEVFLKINGRLHYLWRAVDQDGDVLDIMDSHQPTRLREKVMRGFCRGEFGHYFALQSWETFVQRSGDEIQTRRMGTGDLFEIVVY